MTKETAPPQQETEKKPARPKAPSPTLGDKLKGRAMVTTITLPSLGIPYRTDDGDPMPEGKVVISSMTAAEEKLMANKSSGAGDKTNILLTRTSDLGKVTADELVVSDRFYLLIKLRSLSYGNKYGVQIVCEGCDTQFRHEVDLERDMPVTTLDEEDWEEPFTVALPATKRILALRLLRGVDERAIAQQVRRKHQKSIANPGNPSYTLLLARHIVTVDEEDTSGPAALKFLEAMPVMDRTAMTDKIQAMTPGFDTELEFDCPNCGFMNEAVLPMGSEFFRPRRTK